MRITEHHLTPNNDLQRSECIADDGTKCRRIARGYMVDDATGAVTLRPPYATPQWETFCPRDNAWSLTHNENFTKELEREFIDELIRVNLNQKEAIEPAPALPATALVVEDDIPF
jgi:hypothetical protein